MTDIVAELRRLYEMQDWKRWDRMRGPADAIALAVVMREALPAMLDAVEATQGIARFRGQHALYMPEGADALNDELDRLEEIQRAALAALEQDGEG